LLHAIVQIQTTLFEDLTCYGIPTWKLMKVRLKDKSGKIS